MSRALKLLELIDPKELNEPASLVRAWAEKTGKSVSEIESLWKKLKAQAEDKGLQGDRLFQYVVGIMKKILKIGD